MLQDKLVQLVRRVRQVPSAQPDPSALQAQRVLRETQVQQDLKVLQATRERLDQLVIQDQQVHKDRQALPVQ